MASEYPNLEEYLKYENAELFDLYAETWTQYPVISQFKVITTPKESDEFPVLMAFPKASFREENMGKENTIASTEKRRFSKRFLDGSWLADGKSVMSHPQGVTYALFHEASTHFAGMMLGLEKAVIYGDSEEGEGDLEGSFDGLIKLAKEDGRIETVDNPTGVGEQPLYTAIFVDRSKVKLLGQAEGFKVGQIERQLTNIFPTKDGKKGSNWVYAQSIEAYLGMMCGSSQGIYVVKAHVFTDSILRFILAKKFFVGNKPDMLIMSTLGHESLRLSRAPSAYSPTGEPPEVASIAGIPITITDAMVDETVTIP